MLNMKYINFSDKLVEDQEYYMKELASLSSKDRDLTKDERTYMNMLMNHLEHMNGMINSIEYKIRRLGKKGILD